VKNNLRIALISKDCELSSQLSIHIESKGHQVIVFNNESLVLGYIYSDPPDIIIINFQFSETNFHGLISEIKKDCYFGTIPIIGLIDENTHNNIEWKDCPIDDFITLPFKYNELFSRISLAKNRIQRIFDNNPLTKLPGNTSIQKAIENTIGAPMSVCYLDINNFKPYNDTFGFTRGDEVIRMTARIISNAVRQTGDGGFAGHIGGDDFVFIVKNESAEFVCKTIINNFNIIVSDLFEEEVKHKGFYIAKDRQGNENKIYLLTLAIAVVPMNTPQINHYGKVAEIAAELKKYAKKFTESKYVINRRKR